MIILPVLILLVLLGAAFVLLMLFNIKLGLFIFFVTLPFQNIFFAVPLMGGMFISLSDIFAALIFFSWLILLFLGRAELPRKKVLLFLLALWLLMLIGCFTSIDQTTSLRFVFRLLSYYAVFVVLLSVLDNMGVIRMVLYAMAIQLVAISIVTNWKYLTSDVKIEEMPNLDEEYMHGAIRQSGIAKNMNITAYNLTMLMPLVLGLALIERRRELVAVLAIALSALFITMSRGGWVAFGASLFFLPKLKSKHVVLLIIVFAVVFSLFYNILVGRIEATNLESDSIYVRLLMYEFAWDIFKEYPILGIGIGNFTINAYKIFPEMSSRLPLERGFCAPHNQYIGLMAENGIIAFIIYIFFLAYTAKYAFTKKPFADPKLAILSKSILSAFVVVLVCQIFTYFGLRNYLYWSIIALIYCLHDIAAQQREKLLSVPSAGEAEEAQFLEPAEPAPADRERPAFPDIGPEEEHE